LHCLLIYYTCDVNICVENGSWHTYAMHSILPLEPGVTPFLLPPDIPSAAEAVSFDCNRLVRSDLRGLSSANGMG
jgi:hypothetical protein